MEMGIKDSLENNLMASSFKHKILLFSPLILEVQKLKRRLSSRLTILNLKLQHLSH